MRISFLRHIRAAATPRITPDIGRDADELIQLWGHAAFARATDLSWREDSGLTPSPAAGHWWGVRREVGRRLGYSETEPVLDAVA